jgi:hypothetical protein
LSSRATLAAWPGNVSVTNGGEQGISIPRAVNSSHPIGLGTDTMQIPLHQLSLEILFLDGVLEIREATDLQSIIICPARN